MSMPPQFIFTMKDLARSRPQGKEILKGIWLSFFPDAKIGILGANGAGKRTLLRIMAGVDKDFAGEAFAAEEPASVLPRSRSRPEKTVLEVVEEAVADKRAILKRYEELSADWSEENADELGRLQDQIDAENLWELDRHVELAMDALRVPPRDAKVDRSPGGERRRVALCRLSCSRRTCCCSTSPRTTWTRSRWPGSSAPEGFKGNVIAVTHDRYFLDNVAGWILELDRGEGIPGRATTRPGWTRRRTAWPRRRRKSRRARGRWSASWSGCAWPRARARPRARRASPITRSCCGAAGGGEGESRARSRSRPGRAWATW